jgi:hypothetical protein
MDHRRHDDNTLSPWAVIGCVAGATVVLMGLAATSLIQTTLREQESINHEHKLVMDKLTTMVQTCMKVDFRNHHQGASNPTDQEIHLPTRPESQQK